MYGVPADLPLNEFVGQVCIQICLGQHQIQFRFFDGGNLSVESGWELRNRDGAVIDSSCEHVTRECYRVHRLLGSSIARFSLNLRCLSRCFLTPEIVSPF